MFVSSVLLYFIHCLVAVTLSILICISFFLLPLTFIFYFFFFFFNEPATTEIYTSLHTLSLHDALPILAKAWPLIDSRPVSVRRGGNHQIEDRPAHDSRLLERRRVFPRKGPRAHGGARRAGIDDMGADGGDVLHFLAIGADQRFQRRLGSAISAPISPRLRADRGGDRHHPRIAARPQHAVERADQSLRRGHVERQPPGEFLGVDGRNRGQAAQRDRKSTRLNSSH